MAGGSSAWALVGTSDRLARAVGVVVVVWGWRTGCDAADERVGLADPDVVAVGEEDDGGSPEAGAGGGDEEGLCVGDDVGDEDGGALR